HKQMHLMTSVGQRAGKTDQIVLAASPRQRVAFHQQGDSHGRKVYRRRGFKEGGTRSVEVSPQSKSRGDLGANPCIMVGLRSRHRTSMDPLEELGEPPPWNEEIFSKPPASRLSGPRCCPKRRKPPKGVTRSSAFPWPPGRCTKPSSMARW